MSYRWSLDGPGFEFPTPYAVENRLLLWRGVALLVLALALLVTALVAGRSAAGDLLVVEQTQAGGSVWPHLLAALLIAAQGALDLLQQARQRLLLLAPGQPGGLIAQVGRETSGAGNGIAWLLRALGQGEINSPQTEPVLRSWLPHQAGAWLFAPTAVLGYRRLRLSQAALALGLLLLLALYALALQPALLDRPAGLALLSLLLMALGLGAAARPLIDPSRGALSPRAVGCVLLATAVLLLPVAALADALPRAAALSSLGLPLAAAVLLGLGAVIEALGWLAACANPDQPAAPMALAAEEGRLQAGLAPAHLLRELDLELHRRWQDGVPNRRYAWKPELPAGGNGRFTALLVEESQPQPPARARAAAPPASADPAAQHDRRALWLRLLGLLGLAASVAGALLWLSTAYVHLNDGSAAWTTGSVGAVALLAGLHGLRVAHLLWSRVEVESNLIWLDFNGDLQALESPPRDPATSARAEAAALIGELRLRSVVACARSVFYAAGGDAIGSRRLLALQADTAAARAWIGALDVLVQQSTPALRGGSAAPAAAGRANGGRQAPPHGRARSDTAARFCPGCGLPLLAGARFCQHCGQVVKARAA